MVQHVPERRRGPRVSLENGPHVTVGRTLRVKVMEISGDGALLGADEVLPVHASGQFFTNLGGQRFEAQVNVRRVDRNRTPVLHGVVVVPADQRDHEALGDFLKKAGA
jgi:hypothetical protein